MITALVPVNGGVGSSSNSGILWDSGLPHLDSMEGFFFLLAEDGRVLFISENVDKFIGLVDWACLTLILNLVSNTGTVRLI